MPFVNHFKTSWQVKYPVLRFFIIFTLLIGLFYFLHVTTQFFYHDFNLLPAYLRFITQLVGMMLQWLGQEVTVIGTTIVSSAFSVNIILGCSAIEAMMLFVCAILAFPSPLVLKLPGIVIGTVLLFLLNLVRIVSLFLIGVYAPRWFEVMHLDVWQAIFILLAMLFFVLWLIWVTQPQRV